MHFSVWFTEEKCLFYKIQDTDYVGEKIGKFMHDISKQKSSNHVLIMFCLNFSLGKMCVS